MGVPGLFGEYIRGEFPSSLTDTLPNSGEEFIETLEFDLGGILHSCAARVYNYGDEYLEKRVQEVEAELATEVGRARLVETFCRTVSDRIVEITKGLIEEVNPEYRRVGNLVLAMDGVAPFAKIMQQRTRRYRATEEKDEELELASRGRRRMPPPEGWQSNSITPGTAMMETFDDYMREWVKSSKASELAQYKVIYSSYRKRGEGEHKLFAFRRNKAYTTRSTKKKRLLCVYGLDADLILLNLIYPKRNIYIVREREARTHYSEGTEHHGKIVSIDVLRDEIIMRMTGVNDLNELDHHTYYSVIRDFVLMTFFLGNDFLPRLLCFRNLVPSLNHFVSRYSDHVFNTLPEGETKIARKKKVDGYYVSDNGFLSREDGSIDWQVFVDFLNQLRELEADNLLELGIGMKRGVQSKRQRPATSTALEKAITIEAETELNARSSTRDYTFNANKFRNCWYNLALGPRTQAMKRFAKDNNISYLDGVDAMCKLYLEGLQWILLYYVGGTEVINKFWTYTYTQAPMLEDIIEMLTHLIKVRKAPRLSNVTAKPSDPTFGPVHQLLSVMPPKSAPLIHSLFSDLILRVSPLCYLAPHQFKVDYESTRSEHEGLAILPIVDPYRIVEAVKERAARHKVKPEYLGNKELDDIEHQPEHKNTITYSEKELADRGRKALALFRRTAGSLNRGKSVGPSRESKQDRDNRSRSVGPARYQNGDSRGKERGERDRSRDGGGRERSVPRSGRSSSLIRSHKEVDPNKKNNAPKNAHVAEVVSSKRSASKQEEASKKPLAKRSTLSLAFDPAKKN